MEIKKLEFKKRRGLGELGSLLIVTLLAVVLITAGTLAYGGMFSRYGVAYSNASVESGAQDAYSNLNGSIANMGKTLKDSQAMPVVGVFYVMFQGAFQAVNMLFDSIGFMFSFTSGVGDYIGTASGVDVSWIIGLLGGILVMWIVWRLLEGGTGRTW